MRQHRPHPALVGRRLELSAVTEALDEACRGLGSVVVFEGAAGLGKSRLLAEARQRAADSGFQVLAGAAEELERGRPLGALTRALRMIADADDPVRAALFRGLTRLDVPDEGSLLAGLPGAHWQLVDGVVELVEVAAQTNPVLLTFDDLQFADALSLAVVRSLGRRAAGMAVCLLVASRPIPPTDQQGRLLDTLGGGARHIVLTELDEADAWSLLVTDLGGAPTGDVASLARGAAGNPFYVLEVAAAGREGTVIGDGSLPVRLREAVLRHLRHMAEDEADVLRLAAILGSSFAVADLSTVSGRSPAQLLPVLRRWVGVRILDEAYKGPKFVFRHDLVHSAIYESVARPVRAALHAAVGRSLAATGAPALRVAHHLALGASAGDLVAVEWLRRAAREVVGHDVDAAVALLEHALTLAVPGPTSVRVEIRAQLVELLARAGRTKAAKDMAQTLQRQGSLGSAELPLRHGLAVVAFLEGGVTAAAAQMEEQLARMAPADIPSRTFAELALFKLASADLNGARRTAAVAADDFSDPAASTLRRSVQALLALYECDIGAGVTLAREAQAMAELEAQDGIGMNAHRYHPSFFLALALIDADLLAEAAEALWHGQRLAAELGTVWAPPLYHCAAATRLLKLGSPADAAAEADAALGFLREFQVSAGAVWPHAILAQVALSGGDLPATETALRRGEQEVAEKGLQFGTDLLVLTRAQLLEDNGDPASAVALLDPVWTQAGAQGCSNIHRVLGPTFTRLLVSTGQRHRATEIGSALREIATRSDVASVHGAALQCLGLAAGDPQLLEAAVSKWRDSRRPLDLAQACQDAATVLPRSGRREDADALLREAHSLAVQCSATRLTEQVTRQLSAAGRNRPSRPPRPKTGWGSLTASEVQVVRLLAHGLSNGQIAERLFVSRRTIESHLYRVFMKLDVKSRAELAVQAVSRPWPST